MPSKRLDNETSPITVAPTPQLRRLGRLLAGASIAVIFAATLTPQSGQPETSPLCIICGSLGGVDALLNVFLFLPLGVGLALSGARAVPALLAMLFLTAGIEVAQFFFIGGRDGNIGDVLTNVLGGTLGFALARGTTIWRRPTRHAAFALCVSWSAIWIAIQLLSSYAFAPALPTSLYYGQIARVFEHMATFDGQVLSATIDTVTVPNFGFAKTEQFHELLQNGASVGAVVIPAAPTPQIAPIVRIADDKRREIVLLGQDHSDLVFGLRTGAAGLRLRPPLFAMREVFPARGDGAKILMSDTLRLRARYATTGVEMRADSGGELRQRHLAVYPALAWILVLPGRWYVEGTRDELLFSFLLLGVSLIPLGYWSFFLLTFGRGDAAPGWTSALSVLVLLVLLAIGLALVPSAFGLPAASLGAWLAAVTGLLLGAAIGGAESQTALRNSPESFEVV